MLEDVSLVPMESARLEDVYAMAGVRSRLLLRRQSVRIKKIDGMAYWEISDPGMMVKYYDYTNK